MQGIPLLHSDSSESGLTMELDSGGRDGQSQCQSEVFWATFLCPRGPVLFIKIKGFSPEPPTTSPEAWGLESPA